MPRFHERFEINYDQGEARRRFVNRAQNLVFDDYIYRHANANYFRDEFMRHFCSGLGELYRPQTWTSNYIQDDFLSCLRGLEVALEYAVHNPHRLRPNEVIERITRVARSSEADIGVDWVGNQFRPRGAPELDESLVNQPLRWARQKGFEIVVSPMEKALAHLLDAERRPEVLNDVITDAYEALEALAKVIAKNDRDLSANRDLLLRELRVTDKYKEILKAYLSYANDFRHAADRGQKKPEVNRREAESFVYTTGLFLRLAINEI